MLKFFAATTVALATLLGTTQSAQASGYCTHENAAFEAINLVRGGMSPQEIKHYIRTTRNHNGTRVCDIKIRGYLMQGWLYSTYPNEIRALLTAL